MPFFHESEYCKELEGKTIERVEMVDESPENNHVVRFYFTDGTFLENVVVRKRGITNMKGGDKRVSVEEKTEEKG